MSFPGVMARFLGGIMVGRFMLKQNDFALTALSGGGQTGATLLKHAMNNVTVVAGDNDSVMLPPVYSGDVLIVLNSASSHSMQVFSNETTGVDVQGVAGSTGVAHAAGRSAVYFASQGNWYRFPATP